MKIYTKQGDAGETALWGGQRVPKDHTRIAAYGTLDELNSLIGLVLAEKGPSLSSRLRDSLTRIQAELFELGAELAMPLGAKTPKTVSRQIEDLDVSMLEREIDSMEADLKPLKTFILPGGDRAGALLHVARTVARRGERELASLHRAEPVRGEVLRYLNRLADHLFVAARWANQKAMVPETPWSPRASRVEDGSRN